MKEISLSQLEEMAAGYAGSLCEALNGLNERQFYELRAKNLEVQKPLIQPKELHSRFAENFAETLSQRPVIIHED